MLYESITDRCISIWSILPRTYDIRASSSSWQPDIWCAPWGFSAIPRGVPVRILADFSLEDPDVVDDSMIDVQVDTNIHTGHPWSMHQNYLPSDIFRYTLFWHIKIVTRSNLLSTYESQEFAFIPVSILRKSISGRHRPVRVADWPMTARCRFT